jgi:glycosyltransferase involved in cell wall biosynthesis
MRVVQAVFGVFHHFELAHQLHRRHHLQRLYSTWPWARLKREGLPRELVRTFPALHTAQYLLGRTGHASPRLLSAIAAANTLSFDRYTSFKIGHDPAGYPDAFIAISGAGLLTGRRVQQHGGVFICDRGSTHQRFQDQVVLEEHRRWGLPVPLPQPHIVVREEEIYAQADAITVPSTVAKRSFTAMGVASEKIHVIPYGVRLDRFKPGETPSVGSFEMLFAGGVSLRKGIPYLLRAFAQLRHPRKHLTVAGSVSGGLRELLPRLPTDQVTFTGPLPQAELARLMSRSHAFVLPSVEEGLALVMAQAMACGCPVIATVATGAEDLFSDGVQGFIVPGRDVAALAGRMQQLSDDRTLHSQIRAAALERVKALGGWDDYGDRWDKLLHMITGIGASRE